MCCKFLERVSSINKPWSYDTNRRFIEIFYLKKSSRKIFKNFSSWFNLRLGNSSNFLLRDESELLVKKKYPVITARK